jgi:hypothetical protein
VGDLGAIGRLLIVAGLMLALAGLALVLVGRWSGAGRLPGDLLVRRGETTVFAPVVTMILVSVAFTLVLNLAIRLIRRD